MNTCKSRRVKVGYRLANLRIGDLAGFSNQDFDQNGASHLLPESGEWILGTNWPWNGGRVEVGARAQMTERPRSSVSDLLSRIVEQLFERRNQALLGFAHPGEGPSCLSPGFSRT